MTVTEARHLRIYDHRFPIDDQSNFQVPAANIVACYVNSHRERGAEASPITDFMPYWQESETPAEDWGEKLKRRLQQFPVARDSEEWHSDV